MGDDEEKGTTDTCHTLGHQMRAMHHAQAKQDQTGNAEGDGQFLAMDPPAFAKHPDAKRCCCHEKNCMNPRAMNHRREQGQQASQDWQQQAVGQTQSREADSHAITQVAICRLLLVFHR